ncbi:hypothetical protein G7Y89_g7359 [Cudoniella acicularis]|uniref:Peroxin/Ferlin domain-containing protein n=1 Tax=Cudoniella acicularis TaxID=354080 RepID=A0A8H4W1M4_9HELO|nr:hypothetical protein G7Y89_g7359 [Cudoniella acicularis]
MVAVAIALFVDPLLHTTSSGIRYRTGHHEIRVWLEKWLFCPGRPNLALEAGKLEDHGTNRLAASSELLRGSIDKSRHGTKTKAEVKLAWIPALRFISTVSITFNYFNSSQDVDYDHEICLVDHTRPESIGEPARSRSLDFERPSSVSDSSSRRHSDVSLRKHHTRERLRKELTKRKYKKYQDRHLEPRDASEGEEGEESGLEENGNENENTEGHDEEIAERGRPKTRKKPKTPESAIDVLFENQRGLFLCGLPLFSSKALGNLDPSPWTNIANKTSATDTTNAQVPDPSWEWAWKEWSINHENDVGEDGWEYSFAFAKQFSWHGPSWWNSFVRRRAWIRKRVKKQLGYQVTEAHRLNSDYFTIHTARDRSGSPCSTEGSRKAVVDQLALREMEESLVFEDIHDIGSLMTALKFARIDREKLEAVENFIRNGGDELYYLQDHMHEIMGMFIFQASRRLLLAHLHRVFDEVSHPKEEYDGTDDDKDSPEKRRLKNLEAALVHADEEVKKLEFWSDVKNLAENGETLGAVDKFQGWDGKRWTGLDDSGPKDVLSKRTLLGIHDCKDEVPNGKTDTKGKGKAKE